MRYHLARLLSTFAVAATAAGCGEAKPESPDTTVDTSSLGKGARGPEVQRAHDYLKAFGYFPNAELATRFPGWRPVVARAPSQPDLFDENLETALRKFQLVAGLPATGRLDAGTVETMAQPRCGHPDVDPEGPRQVDKFSVQGPSRRWQKTNIRVKFAEPTRGLLPAGTPGDPNLTVATIINAIAAWSQVTNLSFQFSLDPNSAADLTITYQAANPPTLGWAGPPPSQHLNIVPVVTGGWSPMGTASSMSLTNVAMHEAGHMLGLDHSTMGTSLSRPMMWFAATNRNTLDDDDRIAANIMYNSWEQVGGLAKDIGANAVLSQPGSEAVWVIGADDVPWRFNPGTGGWNQIPGITGTRIDVDNNGHAWVVAMNKKIYRYVPSANPVWQEVPGNLSAVDIGIGSNRITGTAFTGSTFAVGTDGRVYGYDFNNARWTLFSGPTSVVAIDVDSSGMPSTVAAGGQLLNYQGNSVWNAAPTNIQMADVGFGGVVNGLDNRRYQWLLRKDQGIGIWDKQAAMNCTGMGTELSCVAPGRDDFIQTDGLGVKITVGLRGRPWVVASNQTIWRRQELLP